MKNLKIFAAFAAMLPGDWRDVVNTETHHAQGDVIVVAATKRDAVEVLVSAGVARAYADSLAKELRVAMATTVVMQLMEAGLVDIKTPGVVVYHAAQMGNPIARVSSKGVLIAGHFRFRGGREADETGLPYGLWVEPVPTLRDALTELLQATKKPPYVVQDGVIFTRYDTDFGAVVNFDRREGGDLNRLDVDWTRAILQELGYLVLQEWQPVVYNIQTGVSFAIGVKA